MSAKISPFQFKRFQIAHDRSAHRVGTDAILLGAWAKAENPSRILDFGSGSGILSLIMAQRFPQAKIWGIEIDQESWRQSEENRLASSFSNQIEFLNIDLLDFNPIEKFDFIISNPPYYSEEILAPDERRARARSIDFEGFYKWLKKLNAILSDSGTLKLILPYSFWTSQNNAFEDIGLFAEEICLVKHKPGGAYKRVLLSLDKDERSAVVSKLDLYRNEGHLHRSDAFQALVEELLLDH